MQQVSAQSRRIDIDANNIKGALNRSFQACVGAGRANEGLRADWQRQLRQVKADCGFTYIRFNGLLSDDMGVYKEDKAGHPMYNFQYIDELFDFLIGIKMKPFVELGFMPADLASGTGTVFWWKGNKTPPKDYQKWDNLIKNLVQHCTQRYGHAEVASWYFEVWNEPNLHQFFSGDQAEYFKLYKETAGAIKSVSKDYRVGGPATAAGGTWLPDLINYCSKNNVPIDFVSTHVYGVKKGRLDESGSVGTIVSKNKDAVYSYMIRMSDIVKASAMPKLELHFTEWSSSYTPTDPIHDHYCEAAYILDKIKHAGPVLNSMSYWTFTDIFEELGPRFTPFHGGFGLMNYQDIKKPGYYAYQFLNQLDNKELKTDDTCAIATKSGSGSIKLLFWDFTITHPGDSTIDQDFYRRNLPAKSVAPVKVKMTHLSAGNYKLEIYKVGYRSNDAYATYYDMDKPSQLTREQVAAIKQQNSGKPLLTVLVKIGASGVWNKELPMRQNDVYFIVLQKKIT